MTKKTLKYFEGLDGRVEIMTETEPVVIELNSAKESYRVWFDKIKFCLDMVRYGGDSGNLSVSGRLNLAHYTEESRDFKEDYRFQGESSSKLIDNEGMAVTDYITSLRKKAVNKGVVICCELLDDPVEKLLAKIDEEYKKISEGLAGILD